MNNTTTDVPIIVRAFDAKMTEHSTVAHSTDGWRFPTGAATCLVSGCDRIPRILITAGDEVVTACVEHTPDMAWTLMAARGELWGYGEDE